MAKDYSEDQLIQRSAAELLEKELGWTSVYAFDKEVLGVNGTLGRTTYHEVLLTERFRKALKTLNPWLTDKQLQECVERMTEHMSSQTLMQINEQKYQYCAPRSSTSLRPRRMTSFVSVRCGCMVHYIIAGPTLWAS